MPDRRTIRECVAQIYEELKQEHGRPPTMTEVVELSGVSYPTVHKLTKEWGWPLTRGTPGRKPVERG